MMKDTTETEPKTGKALWIEMRQTAVESKARLENEIAQLEGSLSIPVMEDSHALILTDFNRADEVRVYGSWKDGSLGGSELRGFKHISILPWHICGTFGYPRDKAMANVRKLQAAEQTPGVTYSYMHFRQLRETVLARLKSSLAVADEFIAKFDKMIAAE